MHASTRTLAGLPLPEALGQPDQYLDARQYLRDFYSFSGMQSIIKPLSIRHPVLYYALAWHAQCDLNVMRPVPDSLTSLSMKGVLLKYMVQQFAQIKLSTAPIFVLANLWFCLGIGLSTTAPIAEYAKHFNAIDEVITRFGGLKALINTDVGPYTARQIFTVCAVSRMISGQELLLYKHLSSVDAKVFRDLFHDNNLCENPFTAHPDQFKRVRHVTCTKQTTQLLCDARALYEIIVSCSADAPPETATVQRLKALRRRFKVYENAASHTDHIYEACRLASLIQFYMATEGTITQFLSVTGKYDRINECITRLQEVLQKTDTRNLWGDFKGVLCWIANFAMCLTLGTPHEYFFKSLVARIYISYTCSEDCPHDVVVSIRNLIEYQDSCKTGQWIDNLKFEDSNTPEDISTVQRISS